MPEFDDNWIDVRDRLPGEQGCDSEDVQVFLNGYCAITDHEGRQGGPWGIAKGYYDAEKGYWRVGGQGNGWVTHWQPLPKPPASTGAAYKKHISVSLEEDDVKLIVDALRSSKGDSGASDAEKQLASIIDGIWEEEAR